MSEAAQNRHPVEALFARLATLDDYPAGVVPMSSRLPGTHFFPGGAGLVNVLPDGAMPPMPVGGVMIVGHNFYHRRGFALLAEQGRSEPVSVTWKHLIVLLAKADIEPG